MLAAASVGLVTLAATMGLTPLASGTEGGAVAKSAPFAASLPAGGERAVPGSLPDVAQPGAVGDRIVEDIAATSSTDAWVVGYQYGGAENASLAEHWNGSAWKVVDTGSAQGGSVLLAVAEVTPDDVWAVGSSGHEDANLALHWDGASWSPVDVPQPPGEYFDLTEVSVVASDQVYAHGQVCQSGEGPCAGEAFRWNGSVWTQVTQRPVADLSRIDAASPTSAWGVGASAAHPEVAEAAHWDGTAWSFSHIPHSSYGDSLSSLAAVSATDAWAAGSELDQSGGDLAGLLLHWDGTAWRHSQTAAPQRYIQSVSVDAADDGWLVGSDGNLEH